MTLSRFIAVFSLTASSLAAKTYDAELVEQATLALPAHLRADASVVTFEDGEQVMLRQGTNGLFCRPDDPEVRGIAIWCYPESHDAYAKRWYELAAKGNAPAKVDELVAAEIKAGTLAWPPAAVNYNLRGPSLDNALSMTVVFIPFATGASLGITEERDFHRPWLMNSGTAFAHIMIPGQ